MKVLAHRVEQLAVLVLLILAEGVFWPPDQYLGSNQADLFAKDPYNTGLYAALIAFLAMACSGRAGAILRLLRSAWPLLPLLALAYLSAFWSSAPDVVVVHATKVAAMALFGIYLLGRSDMPGLVALFVKASLVAAAASFLVAAIAPGLELSTDVSYPHAWRGAFTNKNELGISAALGIVFAVHAFGNRYGPRLLSGIAIPANVVLLYLSDSITSQLMLPAALYVALLGSAFRRHSGAGLVAGFGLAVLGLAGAAIAAGAFDQLLAMLGRNPTLTGRTRIWESVMPFIAQRPWLGYGFDTFWRPHGVEANQVWGVIEWQAPSAHNSWLEMALDLGLIGCGLAAFAWLAAFWRGARLLFASRGGHAVFGLVLLAATLVDNLTEYTFFTFPLWALFAAVLAHFGQELLAGRTAAPKPRIAIAGRYRGAASFSLSSPP